MTKKLPFEIVKKVFSNVEKDDLRECQLVCRQWNQVALEELRNSLCFYDFSEETALNLIQTLDKFPDIARQVKHLNLDIIKDPPRDDDSDESPLDWNIDDDLPLYWSIEDLLKEVLELCPNIDKITSTNAPIFEVWEIMLNAINEGQLQHLNIIPIPNGADMAFSYLSVALALKSRLKQIHIQNDFRGIQSVDEAIFKPSKSGDSGGGPFSDPWLLGFTKLEKLTFIWQGNGSLLDCEAIINNCCKSDNLKSLDLSIKPWRGYNIPDLALSSTLPHSGIKQFKCLWDMLGSNAVIQYLIHKFPNVEDLTIKLGMNRWNHADDVSKRTLLAFFRHLSRIPKFDVECYLETSDVADYLDAFIKDAVLDIVLDPGNYSFGDEKVTIVRQQQHPSKNKSINNSCKIIIRTTSSFWSFNASTHMEWLEKLGEKIESLNIRYIGRKRDLFRNDDNSTLYVEEYDHWADYVLQYCISLKSLNIICPGYIILDNSKSHKQNIAIQQLTLQYLSLSTHHRRNTLLSELSRRLLSLTYLFMDSFIIDHKSEEMIKAIHMPFTSFDTLAFGKEYSALISDRSFFSNVYLKVTAEKTGISYIDINVNRMTFLSKQSYDALIESAILREENSGSATRPLALDIRCKKLASFSIAINQEENRIYNLDL